MYQDKYTSTLLKLQVLSKYKYYIDILAYKYVLDKLFLIWKYSM